MARAPFQVLVLPYRRTHDGTIEYAVFRRADTDVWQPLAGGGEGHETPEQAAAREAYEEACIPQSAHFVRLTSVGSIPVHEFSDRTHWDPRLPSIPEFSFGVEVAGPIRLSREHSELRWLPRDQAVAHVKWESNRRALLELDARLAT